ncbi:hypothetical protein R3P38DRAFT_3176696 [Favolaschia claudopus]|uniref:Uncharacterized protein n=1 Tax=Favolaschia claudopus TaxID=2862362 RepID=A0AAW0D024_9AGAR
MFKSTSRAFLIVAVMAAISGFASANPVTQGDSAPESTTPDLSVKLCTGAANSQADCFDLHPKNGICVNFVGAEKHLYEKVKEVIVPEDVFCLLYRNLDCELDRKSPDHGELYFPEGEYHLSRIEDLDGDFLNLNDWARSLKCYELLD